MGFQDRPYLREQQGPGWGGYGGGGRPRMSLGFPPLTPCVKLLIVINCIAFVIQMISKGRIEVWLVAVGQPPWRLLQVWRLVTFQFLHGNFMHLFLNMLGLYFFGTAIERIWNSRYFLYYYLVCGVVGGLLFEIASALGAFQGNPLVGASGGVLGVMAACAILFPQMKVYLYFLFPIPIRALIAFITVGFILTLIFRFDDPRSNAGGDLCHLGGMATGFVWILGRGHFDRMGMKLKKGTWERKQQQQMQFEYEVDRILKKLHEQGINSLSKKEKQILQKATEEQKKKERRIYRSPDY